MLVGLLAILLSSNIFQLKKCISISQHSDYIHAYIMLKKLTSYIL